jgi:hypothetical protein
VARAKKEPVKISPEQRMREVWEQQVFFFKKRFPQSEAQLQKIIKKYTKKAKGAKVASFAPTEEAVLELRDLYGKLVAAQPASAAQAFALSQIPKAPAPTATV